MHNSKSGSSPTIARGKWRRFSAIELLIALGVLLASFPFVEPLKIGPLIESILMTFVLITSVLAIAERRRIIVIAVILAVPAVLGRWVYQFHPDVMSRETFLIASIVFVIFVIGNLLHFVLTAPSVDTEILCMSVSAFLLLGLLWTFAYWLVDDCVPNAFAFSTLFGPEATISGLNGMYFSFITLSTLGYGDIAPVARIARTLAAMEAVTGLLYVAILIARLVALHTLPKSNADES